MLHANILMTLIANSSTLLGKYYQTIKYKKNNNNNSVSLTGDLRGTAEKLKPIVGDLAAAVLEH